MTASDYMRGINPSYISAMAEKKIFWECVYMKINFNFKRKNEMDSMITCIDLTNHDNVIHVKNFDLEKLKREYLENF